MNKTTAKEQERQEAIDRLRDMVKPGDTLYTLVRHATSSGMTRYIDVYKLVPSTRYKGEIDKVWLSYNAAKALDWPFSDNYDSIKVGGAGMDMGFHTVYTLSRILFKDGFSCIGKKCPSNDHFNGMPRPARATKSIVHSDPGYALNQKWL